jgi:hypothetical protein
MSINHLLKPVFTKKSWGSEIIWSITDHYISKTIEVDPYKATDLVVYENKEKSIIVIMGTLILASGPCCNEEKDLEYHELPDGWTKYIDPGIMHRYGATDKSVRLIEVSSPELDDAIIITPVDELNIGG